MPLGIPSYGAAMLVAMLVGGILFARLGSEVYSVANRMPMVVEQTEAHKMAGS